MGSAKQQVSERKRFDLLAEYRRITEKNQNVVEIQRNSILAAKLAVGSVPSR